MELPDNLHSWLRSTNLFSIPSSQAELPEDLTESFLTGIAITKLLKRLNQIKVKFIQNKHDRLSTPMPEMNTLKHATTPAAKLYNWNILTQVLAMFNIPLDPDTKSLIIAGDREMLIEVLSQIFEAEHGKPPKSAKQESGLVIDSINEQKALFDAESCLEFLILSFCHNFSLKPKQGIGLLAQGCKYLAHIIAKGLKGNFDPVQIWLQEIYAEAEKLCELIANEQQEDSLQFVMNALKPGLLSKDNGVVTWTFRVLSRLALDLIEADLVFQVWKWFEDDSVLELCIIALRRVGEEVFSNALDMFLQIATGHYYDLFCTMLQSQTKDKEEYLKYISSFIPHILQSNQITEEIANSGCIGYWIEVCMEGADSNTGKSNKTRIFSINLLRTIIQDFFTHLSDSEGLINNALNLVNRACRDGAKLIEIIAITVLFDWLEFFAEKKSSFAPTVYRTLTFLLVEIFNNVEMREYVILNFAELFKRNSNIPVGVLVEPYVKMVQVTEGSLNIFDYDFLIVLSQYPKLSVKHGIQLIDLLGKFYLNDLFYSKAAGVPFTYLASRFIENETMQDFLFIFSKHALGLAMSTESKLTAKSRLKKSDLTENTQQRNRIFDLVSWIVQQWQENLNNRFRPTILKLNYSYSLTAKKNSKGLISILSLLGNIENLMEQFKQDNPELFEEELRDEEQKTPENKILALVPVSNTSSKVSLAKKKPFFPWDRAAGDIEKAKKKKQEKDLKIKEDEEKKRKALDYKKKKIKQQLEVRKLEQGVGRDSSLNLLYDEGFAQKLVAPVEEFQLKEFNKAENDQLESVKMMINKYSRVFKVLFQKYSGTGFARKAQNKSDFDMHAERKERITDAEYIKILNDHNIIPKLCNKEELRVIIRAYNHKIAKQAEQNFVDYEGFKGVFCQVAYFVYSKKQVDYSHLPPVVSIKMLIEYMREFLKNKGLSTELFDEPDPGIGDKDVVKSLNKLLSKDPNTHLPEGYKRVADKDLKVEFKVPKVLGLPKAYKAAVEILDSVLAKIGIHILEPQVEYFNVYRAKGAPKEKLEKSDSRLETVQEKPIKDKIKQTISMISTNAVKLSPTLKFCIAHANPSDKEVVEECASLLEDILHSVQLKLKRVINRQPKGGAQEEKFEQKKEKERKDEEQRKSEEERKRRLRQQQLQEDLNKAKDERATKLRQDEAKRKAELATEEARKREKQEKEKRNKEEKAKQLLEWAKKKEDDSKRSKEEEDSRKKQESESLKKFEEAKKRNQERYEASLQEKKKKLQEIKEEENKKQVQEKEYFEKKKQLGLERHKELKTKEQKADNKANDLQVANNAQAKVVLGNLNANFDCIFTFYLTLTGKEMPDDACLPWNMYDKFSSQFDLYSVISQDQNLHIFKGFTKRKTNETLSFEDFKTAMAVISSRAREYFRGDEPAEILKEFLSRFEINLPIPALKAKMKKLNPEKKPLRKLKNTPKSKADLISEVFKQVENTIQKDEEEKNDKSHFKSKESSKKSSDKGSRNSPVPVAKSRSRSSSSSEKSEKSN